MRLTFYGGARTVTGSKYLLDTGSKRLLIDCGLFQGEAKDENHFNQLPFDPNEIDYAIMTHGHLDHVGLLPLMARDQWRGMVVSTPATRDVAGFILFDSAKQMMRERAFGEADYHFEAKDVERMLEIWKGVPYEKVHDLGDGITIRFFEAGHILGSASVEVNVARNGTTKTVVFSGDLGRPGSPILRDPAKIPGADVALIESTYGDRLHDNAKNTDRLKAVVKQVAADKGHLLIPAFAIGRTQALLWELDGLITRGEVPKIPVFVDSPLGTNITNVYRRHDDCFDQETKDLLAKGDRVFDFPGLVETRGMQDSSRIEHVPGPALVIAGSGMMNGGRILRHLENFIGDPKTTILIVGYQAVGTLGRKLLEGATEAWIENQKYPVKAKVQTINGFSAHADRDELCAWLGNFGRKPSTLFCTHGEAAVIDSFAKTIQDRFSIKPTGPALGDSVEI
jgi:metallo-beta-lactamase family protein